MHSSSLEHWQFWGANGGAGGDGDGDGGGGGAGGVRGVLGSEKHEVSAMIPAPPYSCGIIPTRVGGDNSGGW